MTPPTLFDPITIKNTEFKNRILRSSMGGRNAYYNGTITSAWVNFERRFAQTGVAGIISATLGVDKERHSPLAYPSISDDKYIAPLRKGIQVVQELQCRYIIQIGDPGGHTHTSLFPQKADAKSASSYFDLVFGYCNKTTAMSCEEIELEVEKFRAAARRVLETGCDGIELTASKGYLIHQFLNPLTNRRRDEYGGSIENRFQLLKKIVETIRQEVGKNFLFGVRLAAVDYNYLPLNIRWPIVFPLRHYFIGNGLSETLYYGRELEKLGVDYLHIDSGFGFINPKGNPGTYPLEGTKLFFNSTRHLSIKANIRATLVNTLPTSIARAIIGVGWKSNPGGNADFARHFKQAINLPIIANGGFQEKKLINDTLEEGKCDLVSIARPLLANPDLLKLLKINDKPEKPCSFCNLCCTKTAVLPLGCYDLRRFSSPEKMEEQIILWSGTPL